MFQQRDIKLQPFAQAFTSLLDKMQQVFKIPLQISPQEVCLIPGHFLEFVLELHRFLDLFFEVLERCFFQVMETRFYPLQHTVVNFQCLA